MDKINITGLQFFAHHGVFEEEKANGQPFSVDCAFSLDTSLCGDDLDKTVHYGEVSMDIVEYCTTHRFDLLEMLSNSLAKYILLKYPLMTDITITVHKPHAPIPTAFDDVTLSVTRSNATCFLALGSNLGDREAYLNAALKRMEEDKNIRLLKTSSFITTKPYGVLDQPDFLNAVVKVKTVYTPSELLRFCQLAEKAAGRVKTRVWGERTLDVDILTYDDAVIFTDDLKIPHPEMHLRRFVLEPLCEIEPYWVHPIVKKSAKELLKAVKEQA